MFLSGFGWSPLYLPSGVSAEGKYGATVIIVGNGIGKPSSNPEQSWLHFTFCLSYLPTSPFGQDMTQGQFFKRSLTGLNLEFSFS